MSAEIQVAYQSTGVIVYAVIRNNVGQAWRADTNVFENYATVHLSGYAIGLAEEGTASRYYVGTFPSQITAGVYAVSAYQQSGLTVSGAIPQEGDVLAGWGQMQWTGSGILAAENQDVNVNQWARGVVTSGAIPSAAAQASGGLPTMVLGSGVLIASGGNVVVPISSISGAVVNSGLFVSLPISTISGNFSVVPLSTLSGIVANSGLFTTVLPANLSGIFANVGSGLFVTASLNSGQLVITQINQDKSGYTLTASGLDTILVESGVNLRQAHSVMAAAMAGNLSGATTSTLRFAAANVSGINRITATVDGSGNRTNVILSVPP